MPGPQTIQTIAGLAIAALILRIVAAILAAIWIFRDAESRGKSGMAAALLALLSGFYGLPLTVMVLCAWVLIRPERTRRGVSEERLPDKLSPEIQAAPSSEEFLEELQEKS
jgi:hypothetical protein